LRPGFFFAFIGGECFLGGHMKTVAKIIDLFGGLEWLRDNCIRLENPPYMRLVIEYVGEGPRGLPAISVATTTNRMAN
jgi:hypothetical protein